MPQHTLSLALLTRAALAITLVAPVLAGAQPYDLLRSTTVNGDVVLNGTSTFDGTLAQQFRVTGGPVRVTRFGAFDDGRNGFLRAITVRLYDATTRLQVGEAVTFSGMAGVASGSFRYLDLTTALELPVGFVGRIAATGYGSADERYFNGAFGGGLLAANGGDGLVTPLGVWFADAGFPDLASGTPDSPGWYGAANLTFESASPTSTVPEPASLALVGSGLLVCAGGALRRRRRGG